MSAMHHDQPTHVQAATTPGRDTRTASRMRTLPPEIMHQACKRVGIAAVVFGSLWLIPLVLLNFVHDWLHHMRIEQMMPEAGWPMPGNLICGLGLAISAGMVVLARHIGDKPKLLLRYGLGYQVLMAALVAYITHLSPTIRYNGVSWLCIIILAYPTIVPSPPRTTLLVSFLVASFDPLFFSIAVAGGKPIQYDAYQLIWQWMPNYVCALIAVVPAKIIMTLGRQVSKARELGAYQLEGLIGRGGMGEVYRARHRFLARPAAIKLIRSEAVGGGAVGADVTAQRFRREAQAAASLRSPHTINLYDFGVTNDGVFYYVMELLEGVDLDTLVSRFGPVPAGRAIFLLRHACHSLGEAHARGLIHRDVKPSNIHTCRLGLNVDFVKVLDFGLVKSTGVDARAETLLTSPQVTTGTPAFMAPEMALGDGDVDHRADIYALGCVAYWLLTGRLVFEADSAVKMMLQHIQTEPVPPSRATELDVPAELDRIILACLAKKPDERPRDAIELARLLAEVPLREPWTRQEAEGWWDRHLPASAPVTTLREETPLATVQVGKDETS